MTQTFTRRPLRTETSVRQGDNSALKDTEAPSEAVLQNILNFSKNLEVKVSRFGPPLLLLKS